MEAEHQYLDKPINEDLKITRTREELTNQKRDFTCSYSLRENPKKKTQKSPEPMKKILFRCEECGKGFRYEKCFTNHQALVHSSTNERVYEERITSLYDSFSLVKKKKRSRLVRYKRTSISCSFAKFLDSRSVFAANDEELEVADCLILLSKSTPKFFDGLKLVAEAVDADESSCLRNKKLRKGCEFESEVLSNEQNLMKEEPSSHGTSKDNKLDKQNLVEGSESGTGFLSNEQTLMEGTWKEPTSILGEKNELAQARLQKAGDFESGFYRTELGVVAMECSSSVTEKVTESNKKNIEHQCRLCNKTFSSYQALGGHQTFHRVNNKRKNKKDSREESVESDDESVRCSEKKPHKCNICSRSFGSVHALGGHTKSHGKRQHSKTEDDEVLGFLRKVTVGFPIC